MFLKWSSTNGQSEAGKEIHQAWIALIIVRDNNIKVKMYKCKCNLYSSPYIIYKKHELPRLLADWAESLTLPMLRLLSSKVQERKDF